MQVLSTGALIPDRRRARCSTFLLGLSVNVVGLLLLIAAEARLGSPISVEPIARLDSNILLIYEPPLYEPLPRADPPVVAKLQAPKLPPVVKEQVQPQIEPKIEPQFKPQFKAAKIVTPQVEPPKPESLVASATIPVAPPAPRVDLKPTGFDAAKAEPATLHLAPSKVQTGGFGDPNGVAGKSEVKPNAVAVASVGSFDLPSGPAKGNGTGGTHGVSGTVAAAGFGNGVAPSPARGTSGSVVAGGFGERVVQASANVRLAEAKTELRPVEIVFKPRPTYTEAAIKQKVEGEVLLDVVFSASGSLHVNRVVKGLGYGLDDQALAVARRIQFRPARRDGQPYDCAALVHIVFELSK